MRVILEFAVSDYNEACYWLTDFVDVDEYEDEIDVESVMFKEPSDDMGEFFAELESSASQTITRFVNEVLARAGVDEAISRQAVSVDDEILEDAPELGDFNKGGLFISVDFPDTIDEGVIDSIDYTSIPSFEVGEVYDGYNEVLSILKNVSSLSESTRDSIMEEVGHFDQGLAIKAIECVSYEIEG